MAGKSTYLEDKLINHTLRNIAYTQPAVVYVGLYTAAPTDDGGGTEVSTAGTAYIRKAVTFGAPSSGATSNSGDVTYDVATADWGTVTHFGVFDAVAAGNLLYWAILAAQKVISSGDTAKFTAGDLDISED